jgi:hypothetical protein
MLRGMKPPYRYIHAGIVIVAKTAAAAAPVNRPYLELAMKLSSMSRDKLRAVAEDLLDITY